MIRNFFIVTLFSVVFGGCAGTHLGTVVVYDADRVVVRDAVLANRSNEAIRAMAASGPQEMETAPGGDAHEGGRYGIGGASFSSGVVLIRPGEVEMERVIGWNSGIENLNVPDALRSLGASQQ